MLGLSSFAAAAPPSESRGSQSSSDILKNDIVAIFAGTQASLCRQIECERRVLKVKISELDVSR